MESQEPKPKQRHILTDEDRRKGHETVRNRPANHLKDWEIRTMLVKRMKDKDVDPKTWVRLYEHYMTFKKRQYKKKDIRNAEIEAGNSDVHSLVQEIEKGRIV